MDGASLEGRFAWRLTAILALLALADCVATMFGIVFPARSYSWLALASAACALTLARHGSVRPAWIPAVLAAGFALGLAWWPWHGRKAFFRDVARLEPGAAREDVRALMGRWPREHPFEDHTPFLANVDARRDLWSRGGGSFDHVVVHYDPDERVREIERIVD